MKVTWDALFVLFRLIILMKVTHYVLFFKQKKFKPKVIDYILCQLYFFKSTLEQKVHFLTSKWKLLVLFTMLFLGVLRYLNKACFFLCKIF